MANNSTTTPSRLFLKRLNQQNGARNKNNPTKYSILEILKLSIGLTQADLKARHAHSFLGIFWYILGPVLTFSILVLAFRTSLGSTIDHYPLYLALGIIIFQTVQEITLDASRKLFEQRQLLKAIYVPPSAFILSIFLRVLLLQSIHLLLISGVAVWTSLPLWHLLWYPLVLLGILGFSLGLSLILFLLGALIADLNNVLLFGYRLLWLATPVFYDLTDKGAFLATLNHYNPFFHLLTFGRDMLIDGQVVGESLAVVALFSVVSTSLGWLYWRTSYQKVMHRL